MSVAHPSDCDRRRRRADRRRRRDRPVRDHRAGVRDRRRMRDRAARDARGNVHAGDEREDRQRLDHRRRSTGSQVPGRAHHGRDRRRHGDPRVRDDQPRHRAFVQDHGREELSASCRTCISRTTARWATTSSSRTDRSSPDTSLSRTGRRSPGWRDSSVREARRAQLRRRLVRVTQDIPPYLKAVGNPVKLYGLNCVGLTRSNFDPAVIRELKRAYRIFFRSDLLRVARDGACTRGAAVVSGGRALPLLRIEERARAGGMSAHLAGCRVA